MLRGLLVLALLIGLLVALLIGIPAMAAHTYGPAAPGLTAAQVFQYSAQLMWDDGLLTKPLDPPGLEQDFAVQDGEPIVSVCERLEAAGLIREASMLRDYLVYSGLDISVQAGTYRLSPAMSIVDVAHSMQDAT